MFKIVIAILFFSTSGLLTAQKIHYDLKMEKPQNHYFQVEMTLTDFKEKEVEIHLPVWAPGSYLVREFSKNLNLVKAFDENGKSLSIEKNAKNSWLVSKGNSKKIIVKYEVYSFELSVRTSFLDLTHGFVSGSGVFMFVKNHTALPGTIDIYPYKDFKKVSTALPKKGLSEQTDAKFSYEFTNYDHLVDCPFEIGNQETFSFQAAGVNHDVAIFGAGNYSIPKLQADMKKITEEATKVFGQNPNKNYTFIIHNVVDGQGGLEHSNSTTLSVNRWTYEGSDYIGFLSLVAHEYFHLWNVKRIRPIELGPFNYDEENYTSLLWVMEGFTSYYDELLLLRAGYYSKETYISKLQGTLNYVESSLGSRVQPLAHSSYDAWIKAYRPNENSSNTTMTYYSRGQLMAALIDAMIIQKSDGTKSLDDFMQKLYKDFYVNKNRGFTEAEFKKTLESLVNENVDEFFSKYIHGTETPDYTRTFEPLGISIKSSTAEVTSFGVSARNDGGKLFVKYIRSNSAAENAGISVNDEIIGVNGYRVNQESFESSISGLNAGETFNILISRDEILMEYKVSMTNYLRPQYSIEISNIDNQLGSYWLR